MKFSHAVIAACAFSISGNPTLGLKTSAAFPAENSAVQQQAAAAYDQWSDEFEGETLDELKWERFTFEGTGGGKLEVKDGQVQIRSANGTRSGIRTKQSFSGGRYSVEARIAKVGPAMPAPNEKAAPLGFAGPTILFDSTGRNRVEAA